MRTMILGIAFLLLIPTARTEEGGTSSKVEDRFPFLTSGALARAWLADDLPDGIVLQAGDVEIRRSTMDAYVEGAPEAMREQFRKNQFFLLENLVTPELLLQAVKDAGKEVDKANPRRAIQDYLDEMAQSVQVSEAECKAFYDQNLGMMGGAPFEQVQGQIGDYLLDEKRQAAAVEDHIRTLGDRMEIRVDRKWTEEQAVLAMDNPVDKARASGKPTMVDFGAHGCGPCDMMTPILADLEKKYAGKVNILFVPVREEQILSFRYGIRGIPVQIFFDKDGKEVYRHTGYMPQKECEVWLKKAGG